MFNTLLYCTVRVIMLNMVNDECAVAGAFNFYLQLNCPYYYYLLLVIIHWRVVAAIGHVVQHVDNCVE